MNTEHLIMTQIKTSLKPTGKLPDPPVFKLNGFKFTVPSYYSYNHSETQWLVNMLKNGHWDRVHRIVISNPEYLNNTYCQYPDSPESELGGPMFNRKAILYLTPLGMAIYLQKPKMVQKILSFTTDKGEKPGRVNQPCYVTNYLERFENRNDIMLIYPFCIMFRRECYNAIVPMLQGGWKPQEPIQLPYRRICQIYTFHYKDIIEYCLSQMTLRPNLQLFKLLDLLIRAFHENFDIMKFEKVKMRGTDGNEVFDYISIPRRLLRYLHYLDRDLLLLSQIVLSLRSIQQQGFFVGPRQQCFQCKFEQNDSTDTEHIVIRDQDNLISLMLALSEAAEMRGHTQSKDKLLELFAFILIDTKWYVKFLCFNSQVISNYFSNLNERVPKIRSDCIEFAKVKLAMVLEANDINLKNIEELYNPFCPKNTWKDNLNVYIERNASRLELNLEDFGAIAKDKSDKKDKSESVKIATDTDVLVHVNNEEERKSKSPKNSNNDFYYEGKLNDNNNVVSTSSVIPVHLED